MKAKILPSQERLRAAFDYEPLTGRVTMANDRKISAHGNYDTISLDNENYSLHRCIWKWMTGDDPASLDVDHKDLDTRNNAWNNLRLCSRAQNLQNRKAHKRNKCGFKGVTTLVGLTGKTYKAQIGIHGKPKYLGTYKTAEKAHIAYCVAATELHKEFARFE
jgi:hypothetical protein